MFRYAVMGMSFFHNVKYGNSINRHANFEDWATAFMLLFRCTTGHVGVAVTSASATACRARVEVWRGTRFDGCVWRELSDGCPWKHAPTGVCEYAYTHAYTHAYKHTHTYVYMHVYHYTHVYTHVHTHVYAHLDYGRTAVMLLC